MNQTEDKQISHYATRNGPALSDHRRPENSTQARTFGASPMIEDGFIYPQRPGLVEHVLIRRFEAPYPRGVWCLLPHEHLPGVMLAAECYAHKGRPVLLIGESSPREGNTLPPDRVSADQVKAWCKEFARVQRHQRRLAGTDVDDILARLEQLEARVIKLEQTR
jgi:hypothetical protein